MSIEVKIDSRTNACTICFTCSDGVSHIADLNVIFRILLKDSPIEVTEAYLETLQACENCSMALRNISNVRDTLINTIALENTKKQEIEYDNQLKEVDALLCSICCTYSQEVSLSDLSETIEMLIQDSSVELTEKTLREMMCCINCHTNLENISQFQSAIVEEQLKMLSSLDEEEDDISMLSSSQTKEDEKVSDYQDSSSYNPAEEDSDSEETSTDDEKYQKGGGTRDKYVYKSQGMNNHEASNKAGYCVQCNKQFEDRQRLKRHIMFTKLHNSPTASKRHKCSQCDESFNFKPELEGHIKYTHENKGHQCPICKKVLRPPYGLTAHMRRVHYLPTVRPQVCTTCNKTYRSSLKIHEKSKRHLDKLNQSIDEP